MSLLADIEAAVAEGFDALDDLKTTVSYVDPGSRVLDLATDIYAGAQVLTELTDVVLTNFSQRELTGSGQTTSGSKSRDVRPEDQKVILRQASVPDLTPENDGKIRIGTVDWSIIAVSQDPAGAVWILQIRNS